MTTLASGNTLQTRYGKLGGYTGHMIAPPERIKALIMGLPGSGKSAFLQSHPDAFIFNLDISSTVTPNPKATLWPGLDSTTGQPINEAGAPMVLTWNAIAEKIAVLKELAATNQPRPSTIVFDSLSAWVGILFTWIPQNAVPLYLRSPEKGPTDNWRALEGKAAWTALYDIICNTINELAAAGYGVYVVAHVVHTRVPIGDDQFTTEVDFAGGPGLWKRIFPLFELSAVVTTSTGTRETTRTEVAKNRDGSTRELTRRVSESYKAFTLTYSLPQLSSISKSRVNIGEVPLPEQDAWAHFAAVYNKARALRVPSATPSNTPAVGAVPAQTP